MLNVLNLVLDVAQSQCMQTQLKCLPTASLNLRTKLSAAKQKHFNCVK